VGRPPAGLATEPGGSAESVQALESWRSRDPLQNLRGTAGVDEGHRAVLAEDLGIGEVGSPHRASLRRIGTLEEGEQPGAAPLDRLLVDEVCGLEPSLWPRLRRVLDLDGQDRPVVGLGGSG
jgi:hypothetical protein